jgi:hypothetical protein
VDSYLRRILLECIEEDLTRLDRFNPVMHAARHPLLGGEGRFRRYEMQEMALIAVPKAVATLLARGEEVTVTYR